MASAVTKVADHMVDSCKTVGTIGLAGFVVGALSTIPALDSTKGADNSCVAGVREVEFAVLCGAVALALATLAAMAAGWVKLEGTSRFGKDMDVQFNRKEANTKLLRVLLCVSHLGVVVATYVALASVAYVYQVKTRKYACLESFPLIFFSFFIVAAFFFLAGLTKAVYGVTFKPPPPPPSPSPHAPASP